MIATSVLTRATLHSTPAYLPKNFHAKISLEYDNFLFSREKKHTNITAARLSMVSIAIPCATCNLGAYIYDMSMRC